MNQLPATRSRRFGLRTAGVASALALAAGASQAAATLSIDAFVVSSTSGYVFNIDAYQDLQTSALSAGGLGGAATGSDSSGNWYWGLNASAASTGASATASTTNFTDPFTQLATAGFSLSANTSRDGVYAPFALPNQANASGSLSGGFVLLDYEGNQIAGDITFQVYYTMMVDMPLASFPADYAQSQLDVSAWGGDGSFSDGFGLLSTADGSREVSGFFTWTFNLGAADSAGFTLIGSAISSSQIPEPTGLALASLALLALGASSRRGKHKADDAANDQGVQPALA